MTEPTFGALLDRQIGTAEKPQPIPQGTWTGTVKSFEYGTSQQKKTPYVEFHFNLVSPESDVDSDALTGYNFQGKTIRDTFYVTDTAMYRLEEFMQKLGREGNLKEAINGCVGSPIKFHVTHVMGEPKTPGAEAPIYSNIDAYAEA